MNMECGHVWTHWQMLKLRLPVCRFLSHLCQASQKCCPKEAREGEILLEHKLYGRHTPCIHHSLLSPATWVVLPLCWHMGQLKDEGRKLSYPTSHRGYMVELAFKHQLGWDGWTGQRQWCAVVGSTQIWVWNPVTILLTFLTILNS